MTDVLIDLKDFGAESHPDDHVMMWAPSVRGSAFRPDGVVSTAPRRIPLDDGMAVVEGVEPGELRVQLRCRGVADTAPKRVSVPDGMEQVSLRALLESQFSYEPPIVSSVQRAAQEVGEGLTETRRLHSEVHEKADSVLHDAAGLVRGEVEADADRAERKAGAAAEQAGLARGHREGAEDAETSAHGAAGAAAEATTALIRDEMDGKVAEAGQHAHLAGLSSGAAESKAATAGGHAQAAGQSASAAEGHAETAGDHALAAGEAQQSVASDRTAISDMISTQIVPIGEQVARDRTAVADDREATEEARDEAEQHRDDAREAAENAQTGAPPEGWVRADLHADVREDLSRARSALQDVPDATGEARGVIRLSGDLEGTAQEPRVRGLAGAGQTAQWSQVSGKPTVFPPEGHDHSAVEISDSSVVGRSVLTAADAGAARAVIGAAESGHTHSEYAEASRVTALEGSQPIIVSSLPSSPLPGRIYLVTG